MLVSTPFFSFVQRLIACVFGIAARASIVSALFFSLNDLPAQSLNDYTVYSTTGMPGRLYIPPEAVSASEPRSLIVGLHGAGGIGSDNSSHLNGFEGLLTAAKRRQAFLYLPQATTANWDLSDRPAKILEMIDQAIADHNINPDRIYLTGFSMGGSGACTLAAGNPDRYAASVPVCGVSARTVHQAAIMATIPTWIFHARDDNSFSVQRPRDVVTSILQTADTPAPAYPDSGTSWTFEYKHPKLPVQYTEWPTGGHFIWFRVYETPELFDWMFAQSLEQEASLILSHPESATVAPGGSVSFSVAVGASVEANYQWSKGGVEISGATDSILALANLGREHAGVYAVTVSTSTESITSRAASLVVAEPEPGRLVNLSVRASAGEDGKPLIAGFVTEGVAQPVLVRGIGPALARFGVTTAMPDPRLEIHQAVDGLDQVNESNDDWGGTEVLRTAFASVGAFLIDNERSTDSALIAEVLGARTAHAAPASGIPGTILLEIYDLGSGNFSRLVNLSARNFVGLAEESLIAGFTISGNVPKKMMIRAVGPGLGEFGIEDILADPYLEIHSEIDGVDTIIAANDDWAQETTASIAEAAVPGAFPLQENSWDAVLLLTLPAGSYTAIVTGVGESAGEALLEIYEAL